MPNYFVGKNRTELIDWLLQTWINEGPPVCFVEGFSGVGKTSIARVIMKNSEMRTIMVDMPDANSEQADNLFLNLATELNQVEMPDLAASVTEGKSTDQALSSVLNKPVLIVIDEFQKALDEAGKPNASLINFLGRLANRPHMPGRVLLLTNRIIERSKWSEPYTVRTLTGLSPEEAEDLLDKLLNDVGRSNEIPQERRHDVVNWLGCNPRAIYVLVASLEKSSLDELIGINPEIWEARDREVSAELLHKLETELLERTIEKLLKSETVTLLRRLSVHRKSVKRDAIEKLLPQDAKFEGVRDALISRFLMEQHSGWFSLNPVVREISLQSLKEKQNELQQAHSFAANHYMRHFQAKEIVESGKLGGYFVEARYHLVQAKRDNELEQIAGRFENHLKTQFTSHSPVPRQLDELNERIATLTALLESPGAKGLEYYLARLYEARNAPGDIQKSLAYSEKSIGKQAPVQSWILRLQLEARVNGTIQIGFIAREAITRVPANKGAEQIYTVSAELLAKAGQYQEAITLLNDGLTKLPVESLHTIYPRTTDLLVQTGKTDEALALLKEGLTKLPVESLDTIYLRTADLLVQTGKTDEALALLKEGLTKVPVASLASLYPPTADLLVQTGKTDEALALLKEGLTKVPVESLSSLYQSASELLTLVGKPDEAIAWLKDGISKISTNHPSSAGLVEFVFAILVSQEDLEAFDKFLIETETLNRLAQSVAYGRILRLILMHNWELAAHVAHQERTNFPQYRPIMLYDIFLWLTFNNLNAAQEALKRYPSPTEYDPLNWLGTWIALKRGDQVTARYYLLKYLNRHVEERELNEQFLLDLWDTAPIFGSRRDLPIFFPILPALLTNLPNDVVRKQYGPSIIKSQIGNRTEVQGEQDITQTEVLSQQKNDQPTWPMWMDDLLNSSETKERADIGIVIALEEEFRELAPQINFKAYYNQDIKQYYYLFERGIVNQGQTPYHCVATFMGAMGPTDAGIIGDRLISQFNPKTIISIGIAGSTDKDVLVGNVVVADQTDEYLSSSKAIETIDKQDWDFQLSGNPFKSDPTYVAHAMNLKYAHKVKMQEWERNCKQNLLEKIGLVAIENLIREQLIGDFPDIQTGHIASGPTVGAAKQFVQWLKNKHDRKLLALEMESAGVLNAAHKRAVSSLIIRGISDYSDERKDKLDGIGQGVLRRYAMNNALSLLWLLMDLGLT